MSTAIETDEVTYVPRGKNIVPIGTPDPDAVEKAETRKSRAGRKTNQERAQLEFEAQQAERRREIESKRATRIQPDTRGALAVTLGLGIIGLATAFTISYATLVAVAEWMKLPWEALNWIVPGFLELLVIFSTFDYLISRSRGMKGRAPFWAMFAFSGVAVVGNASHTISEWGVNFGVSWQSLIGTLLSAAAPLVVVYISKRLSGLVFVTEGE